MHNVPIIISYFPIMHVMSMCGSACEIAHAGNDNKLCCVPTVYRYFLLDIHVDCLSHTMSSH